MDLSNYFWVNALRQALKRNRREAFSRYFQLATVDASGNPRARTVVYRGLDDDGQSPLFITDTRSNKMHNLHLQPVEACWYFPISREQFRIAGRAEVFTPVHRQHAIIWRGLSDTARVQFFWPAPGNVLIDVDSTQESPNSHDISMPPESFCVVAIRPERIDHLCLGNPQQRIVSEINNALERFDYAWTAVEVTP